MKFDHKILCISILIGICLWVIDAGTDVFLFKGKTFLDSLLFDIHDVYGRCVTLAIVLASGTFVARGIAGRKAAENELTKANEQLEMKVEERTNKLRQVNESLQDSEKRLQSISLQLLTVQELKRKEISKELHDEFGQTLAMLKQCLWRVQRRVEAERSELAEDIREGLQRVDEVIENVRRISRNLSPHILEHGGLSIGLQKLIKDFSKHYDINVSTELNSLDHKIPKESHIIVYRIFQEVLNNVGKHAFASHLSIFVRDDGNDVSFLIEDNGRGFDVNHTILRNAGGKGFGLAILDERVKVLGGRLALWSQEGKGTRVSFNIPVNHTATH